MICATITYAGINSPEVANKLLWELEQAREREVKYMRFNDTRAWKSGRYNEFYKAAKMRMESELQTSQKTGNQKVA